VSLLLCMLMLLQVVQFPVSAEEASEEESEAVTVSYRAHVQDYGWQDWQEDGELSGSTGLSRRVEAIRIKVSGDDIGIEYRTHVQNVGWTKWVSDGEISGTMGKSYRVEAVEIKLTGKNADQYDVKYAAHIQDKGWSAWKKNGATAGTVGLSKRIESLRIVVTPKDDETTPSYTDTSAKTSGAYAVLAGEDSGIAYSTHVQNVGWLGWSSNGTSSGTSGRSLRMEAMCIKLINPEYDGKVEYCTHIQNIGWQDWVSDGSISGTSGRSLRLEALKVRLTGDMESHYDVYYRVHAQNFGWLDWAKNGDPAGTQGYSYRLEAVQIKLVEKGGEAPGSTTTAFKESNVREQYSQACAVLDQVGWSLSSAYYWSSHSISYANRSLRGTTRSLANVGFSTHTGNCYVMAATFCEMARALGYECYQISGWVPRIGGGVTGHSWVEIYVNGSKYVCDPCFQYETGYNGYLIYYGMSGTWVYSNYSRMD